VVAGQVNTRPPAPGRTIGQILRANVLTRFNAILGVLFVLVMIVGPPQDAVFGVVLAVNVGIGVAQELRARRALDKLAILTAACVRVLRDGGVSEVAQARSCSMTCWTCGAVTRCPWTRPCCGPRGWSWMRRC
jgi:cation-transporting ATPase E